MQRPSRRPVQTSRSDPTRRRRLFPAAGWLLLSVALLAAPGCREAPPYAGGAAFAPPLPEGGSVFFVGNSFFGYEGRILPEWLTALGAAKGIAFRTGADIVPGDLPLSDFLDHPAVKEALASRAYGVWVLQAHELEPVEHPQGFRQAVRDFDAAIRASGGRTILFMTWEFPWRKFLPQLAAAYDSIGGELGIPVIPAGLAYRDCRLSPPPGYEPFFLTASAAHPRGDLHENKFGSALDAYAVFGMLTGTDPGGTPFSAPGSDIDAEMLRYLSDRAWARDAQRLVLAGGSPSPSPSPKP